ncbi:MAG: hypothetical protein WCL39_14550, partial [Armatimonadota bacterium]
MLSSPMSRLSPLMRQRHALLASTALLLTISTCANAAVGANSSHNTPPFGFKPDAIITAPDVDERGYNVCSVHGTYDQMPWDETGRSRSLATITAPVDMPELTEISAPSIRPGLAHDAG